MGKKPFTEILKTEILKEENTYRYRQAKNTKVHLMRKPWALRAYLSLCGNVFHEDNMLDKIVPGTARCKSCEKLKEQQLKRQGA